MSCRPHAFAANEPGCRNRRSSPDSGRCHSPNCMPSSSPPAPRTPTPPRSAAGSAHPSRPTATPHTPSRPPTTRRSPDGRPGPSHNHADCRGPSPPRTGRTALMIVLSLVPQQPTSATRSSAPRRRSSRRFPAAPRQANRRYAGPYQADATGVRVPGVAACSLRDVRVPARMRQPGPADEGRGTARRKERRATVARTVPFWTRVVATPESCLPSILPPSRRQNTNRHPKVMPHGPNRTLKVAFVWYGACLTAAGPRSRKARRGVVSDARRGLPPGQRAVRRGELVGVNGQLTEEGAGP